VYRNNLHLEETSNDSPLVPDRQVGPKRMPPTLDSSEPFHSREERKGAGQDTSEGIGSGMMFYNTTTHLNFIQKKLPSFFGGS
jgi:hypothetical protein